MNQRCLSRLWLDLCISVFICGVILSACGPTQPSVPVAGSATMGVSRAPEAAPPYSAIESIEPWSFNSADGRLVRTAHYRLFTTQPDTVFNARIPLFLESALAAYRTIITASDSPSEASTLPEPSLKLDTYILRSRSDWTLLTRQTTGDQTDLFLRIRRGGFAFGGKSLLFDIGARDTLSIIAHEGWHQYTQRAFQQPLPVWLEEGMATYMEGYRFDGARSPRFLPWFNTERFDALRRAAATNRLMPLQTLLNAAPQTLLGADAGSHDDVLTYYAQVWAFTHFLAEGAGGKHRAGLAALLKDASSGSLQLHLARTVGPGRAETILALRRGPGVFEAYFGDVGSASGEYRVFLKTLVNPGARSAIVAGESPVFAASQNVK